MLDKTSKEDDLIRMWTDLYLNQKLTPLQKRLSDWWISEGFFYASNFDENEAGTTSELILLLGDSADNLLVTNELSKSSAEVKVKQKQNQGWEMIPFGESRYLLIDTEANRKRIQRLLEENIRRFIIKQYSTKLIDNKCVLKSVLIEISKR